MVLGVLRLLSLEASEAASQEAAKKRAQNGVRSRGRRRSALRHGRLTNGISRPSRPPRCMAMRVARQRGRGTTTNADTSDLVALRVRSVGALSSSTSEAGAGLLLLRALRRGLLSARPGAGFGGWVTLSGSAAHGWVGGRDGQLRGGPRVSARAGRSERADGTSSAQPRRWGARSLRTKSSWSSRRGQTNHWRRRCTWGWMVRVCRCAKRSW